MIVVTITIFGQLYTPLFISEVKRGGHLVVCCIVGTMLVWVLLLMCYFSNPGYISVSSVSHLVLVVTAAFPLPPPECVWLCSIETNEEKKHYISYICNAVGALHSHCL